MGAGLPAGTVTFLMTDVEGSSRLWERDPKAASGALVRRQEIVQQATSAHNGVLPAEQGEGDSTLSVFVRASDAAASAVAIQRTLGETVPDVRVRIGLHTGEVEPPSGGAYRGAVLNRCARLRAIGSGGQILVSQATYELLVEAVEPGSVLRDLGTHRLRDLSRPEHVWQLCHPDLPDAFPPLRSLDAVANNLPVQLTSFVGREAEIEAVRDLVSRERVVTLTGAGGSGKTRLAQQVATSLVDDYPDGIWWVDLAPLDDPSMVPATLAGVLGIQESPLEPITETVACYLAPHRALVVFDNCEHLIEPSAALVGRLTQGCSTITVVATSREPLRVAGETVWATPPLTLPPDPTDVSLDCEAVRLFVDRARASQPAFSLSERNSAAVGRICTRLDGIPLAIELAAARTRLLSVDEIGDGLSDRFHLLTGGARTALPRQRTLESSVGWSHDLLGDDERVVFRRLAVFAGSFTLEAAQEVCSGGPIEPGRILELLGALVDRSLVQVSEEAENRTRYRMLETIRDFARHKLSEAGEAEAVRDRHIEYYVAFAERAAAGLEGPHLLEWLSRVDAELDNLRAAVDWSPRSAEPNRGARLVGSLCLYWFARSELGIGRARLETVLEATSRDAPERSDALAAICAVCYRASDMVAGARYGDEAIALARELGDARSLARALFFRAWVWEWGEADHETAKNAFEEAAAIFRETGDTAYRPLNLALYAWACVQASELARGRTLAEEALALTDANPAPHARCYCLISVGLFRLNEMRMGDVNAHLREAITTAQKIGDHYAEICARMFLTWALVPTGRLEEARASCEQGLATALKHRSPNCESFMRLALANVYLSEGSLDRAAAEIDAALELTGHTMPVMGAICRVFKAGIAVARSQLDDARRLADKGISLARRASFLQGIVHGLEVKATLARLEGEPHRAEDLLHEVLDLTSRADSPYFALGLLDDLAAAVSDQGRFEEAARLLAAAGSAREETGVVLPPAQRSAHHELVSAVREGLTPEAFDAAWRDGSALSLDETVAYARRGRGKRKRPAFGWNSLTPTELQVAELVTEGLTNRQIGEKLFISPRTVQTHLSRVFEKLGVSTRAEVAAYAARREGLEQPQR